MHGLGSLRSVASAGDSAATGPGEEGTPKKVLGSKRLRNLKTFLQKPKNFDVERETKKSEKLLGSTTLRKAKNILSGQSKLVDLTEQRIHVDQPAQELELPSPAAPSQSKEAELPSSAAAPHSKEQKAAISLAAITADGDPAASMHALWLQETLRVMSEDDHTVLHSVSTRAPLAEAAKDTRLADPSREKLRKMVAERPALAGSSLGEQARFLTLHHNDAARALKGLQDYYSWLASPLYGAEKVGEISEATPGMEAQLRSGKCYLVTRPDREERPVVVVHVDRHDPSKSPLDETTLLVVFTLFAAQARLSSEAAGTFAIVFDLSKARYNNVDLPLIQRFVSILTNFYPERLGVMLLYDAPGFFPALCWPLIKPWLNPVTRSKVHFVSSSAEPASPKSLHYWLGAECLPVRLGGDDDTDYIASMAEGAAASR